MSERWDNKPANTASSRPVYPLPTSNPYTVVFQDTFSLPSGQTTAPVNAAKWSFEQGVGTASGSLGWGNNELQAYTTSRTNAEVTASGLEIRLINQPTTAYDGTANWSSAKLVTKGKFCFTFGRVDAVIKVPYGKGAWPAS